MTNAKTKDRVFLSPANDSQASTRRGKVIVRNGRQLSHVKVNGNPATLVCKMTGADESRVMRDGLLFQPKCCPPSNAERLSGKVRYLDYKFQHRNIDY